VKVLFTAHSLPQRIIASRRPVPDRAARHRGGGRPPPGLGRLEQLAAIAWQSAGRTPEPWLGPDILQVIDDLAASENDAGRTRGAWSAPVGFVADHLEVLYDLDIEAAHRAAATGWPSPAPRASTTTRP
jgi:ferrochelatase